MLTAGLINVAFLILFISYVAQFLIILGRIRHSRDGEISMSGAAKFWPLIAMSLIVPILIAFLPEILSEAIGFAPGNAAKPAPGSLLLFVGVRFLIAYLITIVTLELALQAQALQSKKQNSWLGLLLINLGFDVASILVFQIFKMVLDKTPNDPLMVIFFLMCAVPTVLTGVIVVCGSYSDLTAGGPK